MSPSSLPSSTRLSDLAHPTVAGLISVIVNYGGTFILVFQAARVAGLSPELTAFWVLSLSIGVGLTGLFLSWRYREPIITAWSTPAATFLITALATTSYAEAVGAYILSAIAFIILGLSGYFEKVIRLIPPGIASGLFAGILLQFGIWAFGGASADPVLVGVFGVTLAAVFMAFPATSITTLAGLALLGTIGGSLAGTMANPASREAALITFLASAANINMLGFAGVFWGLVIGLIAYVILNGKLPRKRTIKAEITESAAE
ncbi:hypothetical protein EB810_05795 [Altererythrobacter sp. FM1]|uniref:benzoate/H(+) symporter BenE family transporter n=1 Tax=Tsuneonella flava TaxID=2055955 RepID=UPI000C80703B|nr:benzoate/H(+) symporter BenE family transporter [Tsuneonella flava]ROT97383.1 hypothetical protein EB810_05795 [Altererythrobacter sp. FM1]